MTSTAITLGDTTRHDDARTAEADARYAFTLILAAILLVAAAIGLGVTGNPFAFAVGAGLIVTVCGAGASLVAAKFLQ